MDDTQKYMDELLATYKGVFNNNVIEGGLRFKGGAPIFVTPIRGGCSDFCHAS